MASPASIPFRDRSQTADLLKGTAVVLMIQVHLMEQFATPDLYNSTAGRIALFLGGPPAAPVFLSVMGFFLSRSRKSLRQFLRRGVLLILGGLLLNVGLNANLLYSIHQGRFEAHPFPYVFGVDILPLAGLSIIIIAFLRKSITGNPLVPLFIALLVAVLAPVLPQLNTDSHPVLLYLNAFLWGDFWWSYFPLFPWLAYSLLGYALGTSPQYQEAFDGLRKWIQVTVVALVFIVLALLAPEAGKTVTNLPLYYHHIALLFLWIGGFLFVWSALFRYFNDIAGSFFVLRYLKWLGRSVTSAYVFQWLIIGNVATEIYRTQTASRVIAWFAAIMLLVSLLVVSYHLIRKASVRE